MIFILTIFIILVCVRSHDFFLKLSSNLSFSIILVLLSHLFHVLLFSFIYFIEIDNMQGSHDNSYIDLDLSTIDIKGKNGEIKLIESYKKVDNF